MYINGKKFRKCITFIYVKNLARKLYIYKIVCNLNTNESDNLSSSETESIINF